MNILVIALMSNRTACLEFESDIIGDKTVLFAIFDSGVLYLKWTKKMRHYEQYDNIIIL